MMVWVNSNTSKLFPHFHQTTMVKNGLLRSSSQLMENSSMHLTVLTIPSLVFKVVADGSLELIEIVPTQGLNPRDFTLSLIKTI